MLHARFNTAAFAVILRIQDERPTNDIVMSYTLKSIQLFYALFTFSLVLLWLNSHSLLNILSINITIKSIKNITIRTSKIYLPILYTFFRDFFVFLVLTGVKEPLMGPLYSFRAWTWQKCVKKNVQWYIESTGASYYVHVRTLYCSVECLKVATQIR